MYNKLNKILLFSLTVVASMSLVGCVSGRDRENNDIISNTNSDETIVSNNEVVEEESDSAKETVDYIPASIKSKKVIRNGNMTSCEVYDASGRVISRETRESLVEYEYDGNKTIAHSVVSEKMLEMYPHLDMKEYYTETIKDDNDNVIKERKYDANMNEYYVCDFEYDSNNHLIKKYEEDLLNNIFFHEEYTFDDNGNMIKKTSYNKDDSVKQFTENEYNSDGNITHSLSCLASGRKTIENTYEYDENGNKVKEADIYYSSDELLKDEDMFATHYSIWTYDSEGRLISDSNWSEETITVMTSYRMCEYDNKYEYSNDGDNLIITKYYMEVDDQKKPLDNYIVGCVLIYDKDGKLISYTGDSIRTNIDKIGADIVSKGLIYTTEMEYNEKGELIGYTSKKDGNIIEIFSREYNTQGDIIKEETTNSEGSNTNVTIINCEYNVHGDLIKSETIKNVGSSDENTEIMIIEYEYYD